MTEDEKPQGTPLSRVDMLDKFLQTSKDQVFTGTLPDGIEEATGVKASSYKLVDRRVESHSGMCPAGHNHKDVMLIEVFKEAAEGVEPKLSLDAAIDQFRAEALADPAGSLGSAEPTQGAGGVRGMPDGTVQKFLLLRQAFETETSLVGPAGRISPQMQAYMAFMQRRRFGGGGPAPSNDAN